MNAKLRLWIVRAEYIKWYDTSKNRQKWQYKLYIFTDTISKFAGNFNALSWVDRMDGKKKQQHKCMCNNFKISLVEMVFFLFFKWYLVNKVWREEKNESKKKSQVAKNGCLFSMHVISIFHKVSTRNTRVSGPNPIVNKRIPVQLFTLRSR